MVECYQELAQYLERKGIPPKIARVPEEMISQIDWKASGMKANSIEIKAIMSI